MAEIPGWVWPSKRGEGAESLKRPAHLNMRSLELQAQCRCKNAKQHTSGRSKPHTSFPPRLSIYRQRYPELMDWRQETFIVLHAKSSKQSQNLEGLPYDKSRTCIISL